MKFRTEIELIPQRDTIDLDSQLLLIGSCFAEHLGNKLEYFKFRHFTNPLGIVFNPLSIEKSIKRAINAEYFGKEELLQSNERWHCFDAHSSFSDSDPDKMLTNLNSALDQFSNFIENASHLVITLGTAWVYRHIETDRHVANCHKIPQKKFLKELLSPEEVSVSLERMIVLLKDVNPDIKILFSVSPVRHLKDGMVENNRSKAHLLSALHEMVDSHKGIFYFPAFEIVMDDLRDYRFFDKDLVHPNQVAVEYVWEQFKGSWIDPKVYSVMDEIDNIQKGLLHRPFNPESASHKDFQLELRNKISRLKSRFPELKFEE